MLEPVVFMPPVVDLVNRPCAAGTAAKVHMSNADAWDEGVRREAPAPPSCPCCVGKEVGFVMLAVCACALWTAETALQICATIPWLLWPAWGPNADFAETQRYIRAGEPGRLSLQARSLVDASRGDSGVYGGEWAARSHLRGALQTIDIMALPLPQRPSAVVTALAHSVPAVGFNCCSALSRDVHAAASAD